MQWICPLKYAVNLMYVLNFKPSLCEAPGEAALCTRILESVNVNIDDKWEYAGILFGLFIIYRTLAVWVLKKRAATVF